MDGEGFVKRSNVRVKPSESVYGMTSDPRGVCLIINNVNFDDRRLITRLGSQHDVERLEKVFLELFFKVIKKKDLNTKEMRQAIQKLATHELNKQSDALALIIMTHGDKGCLCGTDYDPDSKTKNCLTYEDVVEELNNNNCKDLRNKPKICFFQACHGDKQSVAVDENIGHLPSRRMEKLPEVSDMLLSFAAQEGYLTSRYTDSGGIYAYHLAHVLGEFSCKCDLLEMLSIVERRVRNEPLTASRIVANRKADMDVKREVVDICLSTSVKLLGWSKKLFFNPIHKNTELVEVDAPNLDVFSGLFVHDEVETRGKRTSPLTEEESIKKTLPSPELHNLTVSMSKLWVLGGGQLPEVLSDNGQQWIVLENTGLTSSHQAIVNSRADKVYVLDDDGGVFVWNWKDNNVVSSSITIPRHFSANAIIDGRIYVVGGLVNSEISNSCWIYDTKTLTRIEIGAMTQSCTGKAAVIFKGKIYISLDTTVTAHSTLHRLNPANRKWSKVKGQMKFPRSAKAISTCGEYIWVFGGIHMGDCITAVERYCPTNCKWETMAPMLTARSDFSVSYFSGKFYAIGGKIRDSPSSLTNTVEIYDPRKNEWTSGPSLQATRACHSSIVL